MLSSERNPVGQGDVRAGGAGHYDGVAAARASACSSCCVLALAKASGLSPARSKRAVAQRCWPVHASIDRKSTRLNSSHLVISYAVFCLKKKKKLVRYQVH